MSEPLPPGLTPGALAQLHALAADWCVRRQHPHWTSADERALDDWLAQQPLHRQIFDGIARQWHSGSALKALFPQEFGPRAAPSPRVAAPAAPPRAAPAWTGRRGAALAMLALAVAGGAWYRWEPADYYTLALETAPGEVREIALPDGSRIALNRGSRLEVRYARQARSVVLHAGEAFFEVAPDAGRPFTVDAGASRITVVGTAFNVRTGPPRLVVQVLEGRVQLAPERDRPAAGLLALVAGTGVSLDAATGERHNVATEADSVGGWRSGQVQFSQTPLDEVAAELARYLGQPVVLADPALATLRVSGLLATQAPQRFLRALPSTLPVQVQTEGAGWTIRPH